ncbi:hypothetical protein I5Q34_11670 [Streptomyces sp. AV19]|uniref:hypothetical protein n=1 Tax=Streptomyces sp. AV19 TaxID=2793068 RepID=UPI0018FE3DDB|nr:hypothetical protein [Streptomyces sp. AV19]MBH1934924.1 hypothetical protein [Streptomyces sp. AV19]MDG4534529.1 hypothetical protein [Streptomyces sp. AV19]
MSGDNYYFGDNVTMKGGRGNTGIVRNQAPAPTPPAVQSAIDELLRLAEDLRDRLPPATARALDDSLPDVTAEPRERHRALLAIAGIAATAGTIGAPVLDAVNKLLELVGAR